MEEFDPVWDDYQRAIDEFVWSTPSSVSTTCHYNSPESPEQQSRAQAVSEFPSIKEETKKSKED